jgi:hypothetical protein
MEANQPSKTNEDLGKENFESLDDVVVKEPAKEEVVKIEEDKTVVPAGDAGDEGKDKQIVADVDDGSDAELDENGQPVKKDEFIPNFKIKIHDTEEHEVDDFIKSVITSKEIEEKVKSLYEKALGLPKVQESRDNWRRRYEDSEKNYDDTMKMVEPAINASLLHQKGDIEASILTLYSPADVLKVAKSLQDTMAKDDIIKNAWLKDVESRITAPALEKTNKINSEKQQKDITDRIQLETKVAFLEDADAKAMREWHDSRLDAKDPYKVDFEKKVYMKGQELYNKEHKCYTPKECIEKLKEDYRESFEASKKLVSKDVNAQTGQKPSNTIIVKDGTKIPGIPNPKSKGSPIKKKPETLDEW